VLTKTILDLAGPNFVVEEKDRISTWTRGLLDLLKRPGLITTAKICAVVTLTRIFTLTWDHATVVRELTTPTLPTFITTCLQQFQGIPQIKTQAQSELVEYVLESFAHLLPRHPTVFRSFANQIRSLAFATLCNDPFHAETPAVVSSEAKAAASQLFVLLHQTAQKGGGAAEWERGMSELLSRTHATLDQVFRVVAEDWQSVAGVRSTVSSSEELPDEPQQATNEQNGFPGWEGLQSGLERVKSQLVLLEAYLSTPTGTSIKIPIGRIVDLLTRLLYVQAPRTKESLGTRFNPQVSREERDQLLAALPDLHVSTLETISTLLDRFDNISTPLCGHILDLLTWLFQAEYYDATLRISTYTCISQILPIIGPTLSKSAVKSLTKIVQACCRDLLPPREVTKASSEVINASLTNGAGKGGMNGAVSSTQSTASNGSLSLASRLPELHAAAHELLPVLYTNLPTHLIPKATRTEMDRTAILTQHTEALAASVLSPAPGRASLLPFLSAIAPGKAVTEAVLRPRMPVILQGKQDDASADAEMEVDAEEEDEDYDQEEERAAEENDDMYKPKVIDWAAVAAQPNTTAPVVAAPSFGSLTSTKAGATAQATSSSTKRTVSQAEGSYSTTETERKKPRIFDAEEVEEEERVLPRMNVTFVEDRPQVPLASARVEAESKEGTVVEEDNDDDDDDDGSDFEIPALVMKTDFEEDEEDEE
jgi:hypothetical protein